MWLVAFQKMFRKIFSDVWLCSWKYHRNHIFYLLLTFSHIFSVTKRIYNIIHFSKHKQNPEKKNHQIRTLRAIAVGASRDRRGAGDVGGRYRRARLWTISTLSSFFLPLSLSPIFQGWKSFEVKMETEMIFRCFGSQIRSTRNAFQFDRIWSNNQTSPFSRKSFPKSVWSQFKRSQRNRYIL